MGRPIKTAKIISGVVSDSGYTNVLNLGVVGGDVAEAPTIRCTFNIGGTISIGWIVRQKGTSKFMVSDGTTTGICYLANTNTPSPGQMSIKITNASNQDSYLAKFNDVIGTTFEGDIYFLTFGNASAEQPAGSPTDHNNYQIARVDSL